MARMTEARSEPVLRASSCILVLMTQSGLVVQEDMRPAAAAERTCTLSVFGGSTVFRLALMVE